MSTKKLPRDERVVRTVVRCIVGLALFVTFLMMFVINPKENKDGFSAETLWEAVHPFRFWDIFGLIGMLGFALYITGFLGKIVYEFTEQKAENSSGLTHVVFGASVLLMLCFFI